MFYRNRKLTVAMIITVMLAVFFGYYISFIKLPSKLNPSGRGTEINQSTSLAKPAAETLSLKYPVKAYFNSSSSALSSNSLQQKGEAEFTPDAYNSIRLQDEKYFSLESAQKFPYQRFDITLDEDLSSAKQINVTWAGQSNRIPDVYAWNYTEQQWNRLTAGVGRSRGNLALHANLNIQENIQNKVAHFLVGGARKNGILPGRIPKKDEYDFTIGWMTDTQYYSSTYPHIFDSITRYIADNKQEKKFSYVIHTGDIVDDMLTIPQWDNADHSLGILDKAKVPYGVLAGNHDVAFEKADYSNFYKYFGEKRFKGSPFYGGSPNNNRDHFDLISSNGMDFVILYLGWKIDSKTVEWANQVLKKYPNHKAIIGIHSYIATKGGYMDQGQMVFDRIVKPNDNVFMVLCGHFFGTASYVKRLQNRVVYELFWNVQSGPEGGSGFFRMFHFDAKNNFVYLNTYSPYTGSYNIFAPEKDEFILPLTPEQGNIKLGTDFINAEVINP